MTRIAPSRQINRAAHRPSCIQCLLDRFRIRCLAVALCAELEDVEDGRSPNAVVLGGACGGYPGQARHPQESRPNQKLTLFHLHVFYLGLYEITRQVVVWVPAWESGR